MRKRQPTIVTILQLGIFAYIFWQFTQLRSEPSGAPAHMFGTMFDAMRLIFFGVVASVALNLLSPVVAWSIGRWRERQTVAEPVERFAVPDAEPEPSRDRHCPACGASLFDDTPACPWCGHRLA